MTGALNSACTFVHVWCYCLFVFLNKALHSGEIIVCLTTDNQLVPASLSKTSSRFFWVTSVRCLMRLWGFPLILGKKAQISLGRAGWRGKTCWQGRLPTVQQLGQCVTGTSLAEQDTFTPSLLPGRKRKACWATDSLSTLLMGICYKESFSQLHSFLGLVSSLLFTFR